VPERATYVTLLQLILFPF